MGAHREIPGMAKFDDHSGHKMAASGYSIWFAFPHDIFR